MLKIEYRLNGCRVEMVCMACGRMFVVGDVAAVACDENGTELGNLCEECAKAKEETIRKFLLLNAKNLRQEGEELLQAAAFLEEIAAGEIDCPEPGKWEEILQWAGKISARFGGSKI